MSDQSASSTFEWPFWRLPKDPTREEQRRVLWEMSGAERVAAMYRGDLSLFQCCEWASRYPEEVPKINNEFAFIAIRTPEVAEAPKEGSRRRPSRAIER
jgi:hypothetical protein